MPSLRELLQGVREHPNDYFHRYRMFEALVDKLEAQRPPQIDAHIAKLSAELAEAKAEIERLDTECDRQAISRKETEQELAEALRDAMGHRSDRLYTKARLDEAQAEIERLKAQVSDMAATLALRSAETDQWQHLLALERAQTLRGIQEARDANA